MFQSLYHISTDEKQNNFTQVKEQSSFGWAMNKELFELKFTIAMKSRIYYNYKEAFEQLQSFLTLTLLNEMIFHVYLGANGRSGFSFI